MEDIPKVEYMQSIKINRILNLIILILLITFLCLFLAYGTSPCGDCRFYVDGEDLRINQFFELFRDKCLVEQVKYNSQSSSLDISNISFISDSLN